MADLIQNQTISPSSSVTEAIITMTQTSNKTDTGLAASFNQTATSQTASSAATSVAESIITLAQSTSKTDTSLTADFNTAFVSTIVFSLTLTFGLSSQLSAFTASGNPIVFYSRTTPEPIIFYARTSPEPIIFYARGTTQRAIAKPDSGLSSPFHFTYEQSVPVLSSAKAVSLITMTQTNDKTDTSLTADFSTSVA